MYVHVYRYVVCDVEAGDVYTCTVLEYVISILKYYDQYMWTLCTVLGWRLFNSPLQSWSSHLTGATCSGTSATPRKHSFAQTFSTHPHYYLYCYSANGACSTNSYQLEFSKCSILLNQIGFPKSLGKYNVSFQIAAEEEIGELSNIS